MAKKIQEDVEINEVKETKPLNHEQYIKSLNIPFTQWFEVVKFNEKYQVIKGGQLIGEYTDKKKADYTANLFNMSEKKALRDYKG